MCILPSKYFSMHAIKQTSIFVDSFSLMKLTYDVMYKSYCTFTDFYK